MKFTELMSMLSLVMILVTVVLWRKSSLLERNYCLLKCLTDNSTMADVLIAAIDKAPFKSILSQEELIMRFFAGRLKLSDLVTIGYYQKLIDTKIKQKRKRTFISIQYAKAILEMPATLLAQVFVNDLVFVARVEAELKFSGRAIARKLIIDCTLKASPLRSKEFIEKFNELADQAIKMETSNGRRSIALENEVLRIKVLMDRGEYGSI